MPENSLEWIENFKFARIDRSDFELNYWTPGEDKDVVESLSLAIVEEYGIRKGLPNTHSEFVSPLRWLKPVCYNAILTCLHYELFEDLEARIKSNGRLKRGPHLERSVFMMGLVGIFAHDKPKVELVGRKKTLTDALTSEKDRERLAEAMWWGFRHYISPAELNHFNRKYPLHKAIPKHPRDCLEPELHNHIALRRASSDEISGQIEHERGRYPDDIEQAVIAHSNKKWHERANRPEVLDPDWD